MEPTVIRLYPSNREVVCAPGDTVLTALEKAGYALPNNCRAGACGECKVKVREGQFDQGVVLDMALSPDERREGYGLMCMAKPLSKVLVIEWGTADAKPKLFPPRENQRFVVVDRIVRTPRVVELRLRPVGQPMRYWPGQYVMLSDLRGEYPARSYSIANAPRPDGELALQIAKIDGDVTSVWATEQLQVGEIVKIDGPYGTFIGDPSAETPVLCLTAGTGLAPVLALTEAALRRGYRKPVTLIHSGRTRADCYALGMMAYWETKHRNFTYKATLTRETAEGYWHGRIPALLPQHFPDLSAYSVFIAGSPEFVADCRAAVLALGAPEARIHTEGFFGQALPATAPADAMLSA